MSDPLFPIRECYCPAHFGNSYEAMWPLEREEYLREMKWWGFNRFSDWMTTTDVCDPTDNQFQTLAVASADRKVAAFRAAQNLGMATNLIVTPNHVYLDQQHPSYAAKLKEGVFGQLVCPSHPRGRAIIHRNIEKWFRELAQSGIRLSSFTGFAYDFGGCACRKCDPWILTFAELMHEAHRIALTWHPGIEPWVCSWWWTEDEHRLFNDWCRRKAPGWLKGMSLHILYGEAGFKKVAVPRGCRKVAFTHIGYGDTAACSDIYTKWGAVISPNRIPATIRRIRDQGASGFQAYSEGVFDDINKAILAGISSGRAKTARSILKLYARRYLGAEADAWADWLMLWGDRRNVDLKKASSIFETLRSTARPGWRLEQLRSKLALETIDRKIGNPDPGKWTRSKRRLADRFWAEQEHLSRDVYRLGPVRHVFARKFHPPVWYDSWMKTTSTRSDRTALPTEA
ncbi:MAG: hypothetical protein R3F07_06840 [Opitutaceae bacterium]